MSPHNCLPPYVDLCPVCGHNCCLIGTDCPACGHDLSGPMPTRTEDAHTPDPIVRTTYQQGAMTL